MAGPNSNSLEYMHWRRCESKHPYRTEGLAMRVAEKVSNEIGELILPYKCFDCTAWHIGHPPDVTTEPLQKCKSCNSTVTPFRLMTLREQKAKHITCSSACTRRLNPKRKK